MTNKNNTTLYTVVTSNLPQRVLEHKQRKYKSSFTCRYNLDKLVYWESFQEIGDAIAREKQIKAGSRNKKLELIVTLNPNWNDLYEDIENILDIFY